MGGTYPGGGYLPWYEVATLAGGYQPWLGGYLSWGGTYPGGGGTYPGPCWWVPSSLGGISTFQLDPPSSRVGTTQSKVGTSSWGTYLGQGSYPPGQAKYPSLTHLRTWGPPHTVPPTMGVPQSQALIPLTSGTPTIPITRCTPSPQLDPRRPPQA